MEGMKKMGTTEAVGYMLAGSWEDKKEILAGYRIEGGTYEKFDGQ